MCRTLILFIVLVLAGCTSSNATRTAAMPPTPQTPRWIDAWAVSYVSNPVNGTLQNVPTFTNQTLRLNIFNKLAGSRLRVQLTNQYSPTPLTIGSAHIALRTRGSSIQPESDR